MGRDSRTSRSSRDVWRHLASIAWLFRRQFALVALLALLATATDLIEPQIYRVAVNDIAGLFVGAPGEREIDAVIGSIFRSDKSEASGRHAKREAHAPGKVAARTPRQALTTLMRAVGLLFLISVVSHWFALAADQPTAVLASRVEAEVIQRTFGHVLRLPLSFFSRRPSAGLAKQIARLDRLAPIVTAAAHARAEQARSTPIPTWCAQT